MKRTLFFWASLAVFVAAACNKPADAPTDNSTSSTTPTSTTSTPAATPAADFASVGPVLTANCVKCHGATNFKSGVSLVDAASVLKGKGNEPLVKPGDPKNSLLVEVMRGSNGQKHMPPMGPAVPEADIAKVEAWIQAGAKP